METREYKTADLYYAAYLRVAGCNLLDTRKESGRVYFVFEWNENMQDLKRDYFNRKGKVAALQFADEVRSMKAQTHETMAAPGVV